MPRPTSPRIDAAERDAKALELRKDGLTYTQIAERLGISRSTAHKHVTRGLHRTRQEPADELRRLEAERLNQLWAEAMAVLRRRHVLVQSGKVVKDDDGQPITDDGPLLQATTTLLRVMERRARLLGLDAPARHEVLTLDVIDAEIRRLEEQLTQAVPGARHSSSC
jgi:hypothetical protein